MVGAVPSVVGVVPSVVVVVGDEVEQKGWVRSNCSQHCLRTSTSPRHWPPYRGGGGGGGKGANAMPKPSAQVCSEVLWLQ